MDREIVGLHPSVTAALHAQQAMIALGAGVDSVRRHPSR